MVDQQCLFPSKRGDRGLLGALGFGLRVAAVSRVGLSCASDCRERERGDQRRG